MNSKQPDEQPDWEARFPGLNAGNWQKFLKNHSKKPVDNGEASRQARDEGMARNYGHIPLWWKAKFWLALSTLAQEGELITAENIRPFTGDPVNHDNDMSTMVGLASRWGALNKIADSNAKRREAHARHLQIYQINPFFPFDDPHNIRKPMQE